MQKSKKGTLFEKLTYAFAGIICGCAGISLGMFSYGLITEGIKIIFKSNYGNNYIDGGYLIIIGMAAAFFCIGCFIGVNYLLKCAVKK